MGVRSVHAARRSLLLMLGVLVAAVAVSGGCGCRERIAGPGSAAPPEATGPQLPPAGVPEGLVEPVTLPLLRLMPDSTTMAMGFPSVESLLARYSALATRITADEDAVQSQRAQLGQILSDALRTKATDDPIAALRERGIDPTRPAALFLDMSQAGPALQELGTLVGRWSADGEPMPGPVALSPAAAEELPDDAPTPPPAAPTDEDLEAAMHAVVARCDAALLIPCLSTDAAEDLAEFLLERFDLEDLEAVETETSGVTLRAVGDPRHPMAYFIAANYLAVSDSTAFLQAVAARLSNPADLAYGSAACPAIEPDEIVNLTRPSMLAPLMRQFASGMAQTNPMAAMAAGALWGPEDAPARYTDPDPVVTTLAWTDDRIDVLSRADTAKHPAALAHKGTPAPFEQALLLPGDTNAFLALRFTPETKQRLQEQWLQSMPPEYAEDPSLQQGVGIAKLVVGLLGDEVTVAVHGHADGTPRATALIGLRDPKQTRDFLQGMLGLPAEPAETHRGVDIMAAADLPEETGGSIYYAFTDTMALVSNDLDAVRHTIDRAQDKTPSGLLSALEPEMVADVPRYGALVLRDTLLAEVAIPMLESAGAVEPSVWANIWDSIRAAFGSAPRPALTETEALRAADALLREIRVERGLRDGWLYNRFTVSFD